MTIDLITIKDKLYAAVLSDILDDMGHRNQVMAPTLRPLQPDVLFVGRARTQLAIPEYTVLEEPYQTQIDAVDSLGPGDVVVASTCHATTSAYWGELFSTAAQARGAVGAIIDGYVRDVRKVLDLGFPLFHTGYFPVNSRGRLRVVEYDVPVNCGGVLVYCGDLIFAEFDGVVVVPQDVIEPVIAQAMEIAAKENHMREELKAGSTLRAAWGKYRVL